MSGTKAMAIRHFLQFSDFTRDEFEHLFARTGMPVHTVNTLPKLLWLRAHEPEHLARTESGKVEVGRVTLCVPRVASGRCRRWLVQFHL